MSDLIERQTAIDALDRIFDRCEEIEAHLPEGDPDRTGYKMYPDYMTVWKYLHQLPSAQPERILYANMSDAEFERRLYKHGICNPNIHESIPCDAVPLLIDNAISELPSAQSEIIRCKDCKYSERWYRDKRRCFLWHETGIDVFEDGYCNYAERRADGSDG